MENLFSLFHQILNNDYSGLFINTASFALKIILFLHLFFKVCVERKKALSAFFLLLIICSSAFIDFSWICILSNRIAYPIVTDQLRIGLARLGWAFFMVQYQSMILLLYTLITRNYKEIVKKNILLFVLNGCFILFFFIFPFVARNLVAKQDHPPVEFL